ncbi:MAG: ribose-5-phosphate isomerase RpiA [Chlamydiales bacterium]|nr:ribose-5-phosphate isomerase RpiA [Chlamydiales bacterium]
MSKFPPEAIKKAVGYAAAEFVQSGMIVGLGTGSTAAFFIERLIQRCKEGLSVRAVSSSIASASLAQRGGIPLIDIESITHIDLTVDGADEIDPQKRMIKGGGGAFVREKIVANMSHEMIVIIDESKLVPHLGTRRLPVEILPFAHTATAHHLQKIGYTGKWRTKGDGSLYVTDNQNFIFDIQLAQPCLTPEKEHETLIRVPGVVDTGFFFNLAGRVVVGFPDGQLIIQ